MSLDSAVKLWRVRDFGFALETTTGTPATIAAAQAVTRAFNPKIKFSDESVERDSQGASLSPILQYVGARSATCEVETELVGTGTTGVPDWCKLLRACGMNDTGTAGTFLPITNSNVTASLSTWVAGRRKLMSGAMGSFKLALKRGQKGRITWNFQGVPQPVTDAANPTSPSYVTLKAPRVGASVLTVGGIALRCDDVEIDKGNVLFLREDVTAVDSASDATGYRCAWIGTWKTIIRLKPESLPLATQDFYAMYNTTATAAFACTVGSATGQTFAITAPALQLISKPDEESRADLMVDSLEFLCTGSAGDDDLSIVMS